MYGYAQEGSYSTNILRNEISFANLIAIANNKELFQALDEVTQSQLVDVICAYAEGCIEQISKLSNDDARYIQKNTNIR